MATALIVAFVDGTTVSSALVMVVVVTPLAVEVVLAALCLVSEPYVLSFNVIVDVAVLPEAKPILFWFAVTGPVAVTEPRATALATAMTSLEGPYAKLLAEAVSTVTLRAPVVAASTTAVMPVIDNVLLAPLWVTVAVIVALPAFTDSVPVRVPGAAIAVPAA